MFNNKVINDIKKRKLVLKNIKSKTLLQFISRNIKYKNRVRYLANISLNRLKKNSSLVRVKNRCIISGKSRGIFNMVGLSRIKLKEYALKNMLSGIKK